MIKLFMINVVTGLLYLNVGYPKYFSIFLSFQNIHNIQKPDTFTKFTG